MFKKWFRILLGHPVGYVSPADHFLAQLRQRYPGLSASQQREQSQAMRLAALRDCTAEKPVPQKLWSEF